MPATFDHAGFLAPVFPKASPELLRLYASAAENAGLLRTDFYTIRDLIELADYAEDEPLQVLLLALVLALDEGSLCVAASPEGLTRRLQCLVGEAEAAALAQSAAKALL